MKREVRVSFVRQYNVTEKTCPECGKSFEGVGVRKYCSDECRGRAAWRRNGRTYRERKKAQQEGEESANG